MNLFLRKILLLLLILLSTAVYDGMVVNVMAVTTTSQRAKEAAKAKKKREADRARKQKQLAREKERRNAKKSRMKALAAKKKARLSEQKMNAAIRKEERNEQADYREEVARIKEHNQKVMEAQKRDLVNSVGVWGYFGYSGIAQNFSKDANLDMQLNGGFGGAVGLGYQLRYEHFLFNVGAEFEMFNSATHIFNNENKTYMESFNIEQYPTMHYNYELNKLKDHWQAGYLNVPVLFGGEFDRYYFLVGPKVGINLMGSSRITDRMTTTLTDDELIGEFSNLPTHAVVTDLPFKGQKDVVKFGLNMALHAEAGIYLDEWLHPHTTKGMSKQQKNQVEIAEKFRYRLGVFADYGIMNTNADNSPYVDGLVNYNYFDPLDVTFNSALRQSYAKDKGTLHPFMVGIKLAIFYNLPKKEQKLLPIPPEPLPRMAAMVVHEETEKPLSGAMISIYDSDKDRTIAKTTGKSGLIIQKYHRGEYRLYAEKTGYLPSDTIVFNHQEDLADTVRIKLRPEPKPIVYTFCAYVHDAESQTLIENAQVTVSKGENTLFTGVTNEDGLLVTNLLAGDYVTHIAAVGYMPKDDSITFVQDTLQLFVNRIKEGKKIRINNLFFATNKTIILPESETALEDLATFLSENPTVEIHIVGHTDAIGSDAANQKLSEGRANAVRNDLIMRGIDPARMTAEGKGESEPVADNDTEEGRALNRRVEFTITTTGGKDIEQVWTESELE